MNKRWITTAALALFVMTAWSVGAVDTAITADTLTYNGNDDTARATGHVVITRGTAKMTGAEGLYRFADQSATLSGGVSYADGATSLTAATVTAYADQSLAASGGVEMHADDRTLRGATVTYRPSDGYGTIDGDAYLAVPGTHAVQNGNTLNGPALEVRLKEQAVETKGRSTLVIRGGQ